AGARAAARRRRISRPPRPRQTRRHPGRARLRGCRNWRSMDPCALGLPRRYMFSVLALPAAPTSLALADVLVDLADRHAQIIRGAALIAVTVPLTIVVIARGPDLDIDRLVVRGLATGLSLDLRPEQGPGAALEVLVGGDQVALAVVHLVVDPQEHRRGHEQR